MRNAVVPAQRIFIEKHPGVSHAKGRSREKGRQHAPASDAPTRARTIESVEFQPRQTQAGSAGGVDNKQVLINRPGRTGHPCGKSHELVKRRLDASDLPEDEAKQRGSCRNDQSVGSSGKNTPPQGSTLQWNVDSRPLFKLIAFHCFNRDSPKRRRRRQDFSSFQNPRAIRNRLCQFIKRSRRRGPGAGKLNELSSRLSPVGSV